MTIPTSPSPLLPPPPPPPRARRFSTLGIVVLGGLSGLFVLSLVVLFVVNALAPDPPRVLPASDAVAVTITGCKTVPFGSGLYDVVTISYSVINHDNRAHSPFMDLSAVDTGGTKLGATAASVLVPAGQTVTGKTEIYLTHGGPPAARCVVDQVR